MVRELRCQRNRCKKGGKLEVSGDTSSWNGRRKGTTKQQEDWKWLANLSDGIGESDQENRDRCEWVVQG